MEIKKVALGNAEEAYIEDRLSDGVNIIFSDDNNKGKTILMQGIMYALGNVPIFPKGFNYRANYFYCQVEIGENQIEFLRKGKFYVIKIGNITYQFDNTTELKYFLLVRIKEIPLILLIQDIIRSKIL